jgi:purine-binding chemotaxis protein CheW
MELQLVVFTLAQEDFGVPIDQVREIIRFTEITKIPKAPLSVMGVINLRGQVIPVIALRERFGFPAKEVDGSTRIIVADMAGQTVGFVVDNVTEVLRIDDSTVEPAPTITASVNTSFIRAIGKVEDRIIILLDLAKVFDFSSLQETLAEAC